MGKIILTESKLKNLIENTIREVLNEEGAPFNFQNDYDFWRGEKSPNYDINSDEWQDNYSDFEKKSRQDVDNINMSRLNIQNAQSNGEKVTPEMLSAAKYDMDKPERQKRKEKGRSNETLKWRANKAKSIVKQDVAKANDALNSSRPGKNMNKFTEAISPKSIAEEIFGNGNYKKINNDLAMEYYSNNFLSIWETPLDDKGTKAIYALEEGKTVIIIFCGKRNNRPYFFYDIVGD